MEIALFILSIFCLYSSIMAWVFYKENSRHEREKYVIIPDNYRYKYEESRLQNEELERENKKLKDQILTHKEKCKCDAKKNNLYGGGIKSIYICNSSDILTSSDICKCKIEEIG